MSSFSAGAVGARDRRVSAATGLTATSLAWLQATRRRGWAGVLWLCLVAAIALTGLLPLIDAMAVESGLAEVLTRDGEVSVQRDVDGVDALAALEREVDDRVAAQTGSALVPLATSVSEGPLHLVSVNNVPPQGAALQQLTASYLDHLAAHVDLVAGALPPEGLGGGETAVTMPRATAQQLGLRLGDRFCMDFGAGGQVLWCPRLIGLWEPIDVGGPYWAGRRPGLQLQLSRYDFFELARLRPPQGPTASLRYWADPGAVDAGQAPALVAQVAALRDDLGRRSQARVGTRLDASLARFADQRRAISSTVRAFAAAVALLELFVVALVAARFLERQGSELAVLRARGWPRGMVWRVAFAGLGTLGLTAVPVGVAACALVVAALSLGGSGVSPLWLRAGDLPGAATAVAANAVSLVGVLLLLAGVAAWRDVEPSLEGVRAERRAWWRGRAAAVCLAMLAIPVLLLPRLPGMDGQEGALSAYVPIAPALGLVLLAVAAVRLRPAAGWVRRRGVAGVLAGWQLERRPEQHAGAAFVVVVAAAIGVFAALGVADVSAPAFLAAYPAALRHGLVAGLAVGFGGTLTLTLAGFGLHFGAAAGRRLREYRGLFAQGLSMAQIAGSLAREQVVTLASSLLLGALLGAVLAAAALPLPEASTAAVSVALGGLVLAGALLAGGALAVGSMARRLPERVDLVRRRRGAGR